MKRLREFDLLLDTDSKFPNLTALLAGNEAVRSSSWTNAQAGEMFRTAKALRAHPDVLTIRLVSGKITFIDRALWMAVLTIGTAREPWQMRGLSKEASMLLERADQEGQFIASGDAVRELEARLLVHSQSVHTERGLHRKRVQTWNTWAHSVQLAAEALTVGEAKAQLESSVARLNTRFGARGTLPWQSKASQSKLR
ncbi:MAG: hypothetical protein JOZ32_17235 [Bryobacterales bacterium]|nr:hypothetical protein [Bryobacterales bacterium]